MDVKLLFVCLGNICRSPAAQGVMQHLVEENGLCDMIEVDSAGTYGGHAGQQADVRMRRAAAKRGYDLTSISRQIKGDDFERFDMIIVMDDSNYERVSRIAPCRESLKKIFRMTDFSNKFSADHIPDPYYEGADGFERVLDLLEDACEGLIHNIINANKNADD